MPTCLIGLGANLGNRRETLQRAVELLGERDGVRRLRVSRWYETRPAGGPADQPPYVNGAATIETALAPRALLAALCQIENQLGRRRHGRWQARPIDLDLLLYDDHVEQSVSLVVPHPRMAWRRFVLEPAAEIAGSMVHPTIGWSVARLLNHLDTTPPYVAVTGTVGSANARFARRVADASSADLLCGPSQPSHARFPADVPGTELCIALEWLRRRARLLAPPERRWSQPRRCAVSDFWFGESPALAACRLSAGELALWFRRWRRLEPRVVRPRLIVLVDVRTARRHVGAPLRRALARRLGRSDVGPVLRVADPRSRDALDDVAAAIQAMA
jgi:2-amino-4-hydroxy-6-hydroxymethyldihydropteridine diphosphokinase